VAGNLSGLVSDPQFQQLSPDDQRQTLSRVTGDPSFSSLSDDDLGHFVSRIGGSSSVPPAIAAAAFSTPEGSWDSSTAEQPAGAPPSKTQMKDQLETNWLGYLPSIGRALKEADIDPLMQAGVGAGKSLLHTAAETGALITDPIMKRVVSPRAISASDANIAKLTTPNNTAQKIGKAVGDVGQYLVPGMGEEKAATLLPKAPLLAKSLYSAATTGALTAAQTGKPEDAIAGGVVGMLSPFLGKYVSGPVADWLQKYLGEKAPANVINRLIGVSKKELQYGNNPGLVIANEGLQDKVEQRISQLHSELLSRVGASSQAGAVGPSRLLAQATMPQTLDTSKAVLDPIDREIASAMSGRVANKGYLNALLDLRDSITHDLTAEGARGNPKNLVMSPADVLDFKRQIGKITRWTPENSAVYGELNGLKREIYHNLDTTLDQVAPGTEGLNSRMSDLISASEAIDRKIPISYRSAGPLTRVGLPALGAVAGEVAGHAATGGAIGLGANIAKDAVLSTPGATARAQALQTATPLVQPARRTLGAAAADYVSKHFPNFFTGRKR